VFLIYQYALSVLTAFGFTEHGYLFADGRLQLISNGIVCILPIVLAILTTLGIRRRWRVIFISIALPITLVLTCGLAFVALLYTGMYRYHREELPLKDGVVAQINCGVDAYCPKYGRSIWPAMLVLERRVAGGLLLEYKMLVYVEPTEGAHIELIAGGRQIRFSDGASKREIVRVLDSDWNSNSNRHCERIKR